MGSFLFMIIYPLIFILPVVIVVGFIASLVKFISARKDYMEYSDSEIEATYKTSKRVFIVFAVLFALLVLLIVDTVYMSSQGMIYM